MSSSPGLTMNLLLLLFFFSCVFCISAQPFHHPLDSLTPSEITQVQKIVKRSICSSCHSLTFHYAGLYEPEKPEVHSWLSSYNSCDNNDRKQNPNPPRRALVHSRINHVTHEIIIDLSKNRVISDKIHTGPGYPIINLEEQSDANALPLKYYPFVASVKKRGIKLDQITCQSYSVGWFGEKDTKRAIKLVCYNMEGTINFYMRPIEGIDITVDLDEMKIVGYRDHEIVPIPKAFGTDYTQSKKKSSNGTPNGPSFTMDGNVVRWADWQFHVAFDMRVGPIISVASIYDHEKKDYRNVMYRGFVSELFVPYQDPTEDWYYKSFFDAGEFGFGLCSSSLVPFKDCPGNAVFLDGYPIARDGSPARIPNAMCIFERNVGDVIWRHTETGIPGKTITEIRPETSSLVVRMVSTVGNYDYIVDWELKQSGNIKMTIGLTGLLEVKASKYTSTDQIKEEVYGTLVAQNILGIRHDHFLNFHLDFDVDGYENSFVKTELQAKPTDNSTPRKSYWVTVSETAKTESEAKIRLGSAPAEFSIVNPKKKTNVGNHVGYRLFPGSVSNNLLAENEPLSIRAGFTKYNVWVTPYNRSEKWSGGVYTDRSHGDDTLNTWTLQNREIENKDIVLWYTLGIHHVPCQEDFPIMSTVFGGFELKPANFFDFNNVVKENPPLKVTKCKERMN